MTVSKISNLHDEDLIGEPNISKFDKKKMVQSKLKSLLQHKPVIDLGDYKSLLPEVAEKEIDAADIDARLERNPNHLLH